MIRSLSDAVEKIYQSFFLRDLLGFILPGSISLFSIWKILGEDPKIKAFAEHAEKLAPGDQDWLRTLAFLGASYLTAWILQSIHYGLLDMIFATVNSVGPYVTKNMRSSRLLSAIQIILWPLTRIFYYAQSSMKLHQDKENTEVTSQDSRSLVTRAALIPDEKFKDSVTKEFPSGVFESVSRYPERLTALMLMTGNIAIACTLLSIALKAWTLLLLVIFIYLEYWRLWYTRNIQYKIHIEALKKETADINSKKE